LLEVVESFKQRYNDTAKRTDAGYLVSALNILNESEINYRAARNKRLHVELALIKLCYLKQALQITNDGGSIDKKKLTETSKAIPFKRIQPVVKLTVESPHLTEVVKPQGVKLTVDSSQLTEERKQQGAKLIVDSSQLTTEIKEPIQEKTNARIGSLESLRKKIQIENCNDTDHTDHPLQITQLKAAWAKYIKILQETKNPSSNSFEMAELNIKDANSFEAIVSNNINQKFLEFERNKLSAFLQKELCNRQLQFSIVLTENPMENTNANIPLSSREQFQKLIEQYPIVKELKDRLRLELDY
ncbi:MAG: DNA polymerase III subunit gamma/tau, partial [Flavisolibacter sp.]